MDEKRKRYLIAGVVVGTVTVGLVVLSRKVPRDQWASTVVKIARDGLSLARSRYGSSEIIAASEGIINRLEAAVNERTA